MAISKKAAQTLMDLYAGDDVIIYLKGMNVVVQNEEGSQLDVSPMLHGIVMEADETFIHLGDGEIIKKSIYHENVGLIENLVVDNALLGYDAAETDMEIN